ncbi:MAG TPA: S41 family peptidase [Gemmatimonadaceae bacterium]|nr:S41 family peptidase [Gemmatimonadaceae bacterium]
MSSPAYRFITNDPGARFTDPRRPALIASAMSPLVSAMHATAVGSMLDAVDHLPGNIGYLDVGALDATRPADAIASAIGALSGSTALIIDLRSGRAFDRQLCALLGSSLFDTSPMHQATVVVRGGTRPEASAEPFPRYQERPVYVLVSQRTRGAAVQLAATLKAMGRATIVGEPTGSIGSGDSGVPVAPDIRIVSPLALKAAHRLALKGRIVKVVK